MALVQVDPKSIAFDAPGSAPQATGGLVPVDISQIPMDAPQSPAQPALGDALAARGQVIGDQVFAALAGQQSAPESLFNIVGKGIAGGVNDAIGHGINAIVPDAAKQALAGGAQKIADAIDNTGAGQAVGNTAMAGTQAYQGFAKNNPRVSNVLDSAGNLVGLTPLVEGIGPAVNGVARLSGAIADAPDIGKSLPGALGDRSSAMSVNTALGGVPRAVGNVAGGVADAGRDIANAAKGTDGILAAPHIMDISSRSFNAADDVGGVLAPNGVAPIVERMKQIAPQTQEGRAFAGENEITKTAQDFENLRGKPLSLAGAMEIDKDLGARIEQNLDPRTGKPNSIGNALLDMQHQFRDAIQSAGDSGHLIGGPDGVNAWREGQAVWAQGVRQGDIERMIAKANMTDNPQTALRTAFKNLASNPARMRGYSPESQAAIKYAGNTGILTGALKFGGSRIIGALTGAAEGAGHGPLGAVIGAAAGGVAGAPLRAGATGLQMSRANAVLRSISDNPAIARATEVGIPESSAPMQDVTPATAPQLALPAPTPIQTPLIAPAGGAVRPQTEAEFWQGELARRQAIASGLTPDVVNAQRAMEYGRAQQQVEAQTAAQKAAAEELAARMGLLQPNTPLPAVTRASAPAIPAPVKSGTYIPTELMTAHPDRNAISAAFAKAVQPSAKRR